jgi:hypothetical protein
MGMSTDVVGYVPRDEKWKKYETIYRNCVDAGVEPPDDVMEFFGWEDIEEIEKLPGREVDIERAVEEYFEECYTTVNLSELPEEITAIRVYNIIKGI